MRASVEKLRAEMRQINREFRLTPMLAGIGILLTGQLLILLVVQTFSS